jgi:hypothetical protein
MPGQTTITTTMTAASSYDLVTLEDVHLELNIPDDNTSDDAWLTKQITRSSRAVQNWCNRKFVQETLQDVVYPRQDNFPFQVPNGTDRLQLSSWPVASVDSVVLDYGDPSNLQTLTLGTDYVLDANCGQLTKLFPITTFPILWPATPTTVQFTAGYDGTDTPIPDDVQLAVLKLITAAFQARGRDPYLKATEQPGGLGRVEYWIPNQQTGDFTPDIAELLNMYRAPLAF